jgi:hypothetical protein
MPRRVTQSLWTLLESQTKLLIEIEVMGAGPHCFSEHFPAFSESIARRRNRLKKIREFLKAAQRAATEAASFASLLRCERQRVG